MSAADEMAKLEARVVSLRADLDEATRVIGQQSLVLASHGKLLRQIDARLRGIDGGGPEPSPVPPPAPVSVPTPSRTVETVTAWVNEEVAKATTYKLNASQMNAWLNGSPKFPGFMSAVWMAKSEAENRAQMKKFIEQDVIRFTWPRVGAPAPAPPADGFHIIVSGEAS